MLTGSRPLVPPCHCWNGALLDSSSQWLCSDSVKGKQTKKAGKRVTHSSAVAVDERNISHFNPAQILVTGGLPAKGNNWTFAHFCFFAMGMEGLKRVGVLF